MPNNIFNDLVIYMVTYPDVDASQRTGLISKLEDNGAKVRYRWTKEVTHVVVQRTHAAAQQDKAAGDAQLRNIFDKVDQGAENVYIVNAAWVHKCLEQQRRVLERPHYLQKPAEPLLPPGKSPATGGKSAKKRRARGAVAAGGTSKKVAEAAALDVSDFCFSSSQQLHKHRSDVICLQPADVVTAAATAGGAIFAAHTAAAGVEAQQLQQQQRQPAGCRGFGLATQVAAELLDALPESVLGLGGDDMAPAWLLSEVQGDSTQQQGQLLDHAAEQALIPVNTKQKSMQQQHLQQVMPSLPPQQQQGLGNAATAKQQQQQVQQQADNAAPHEDAIEDSDSDNDAVQHPLPGQPRMRVTGAKSSIKAAAAAGAWPPNAAGQQGQQPVCQIQQQPAGADASQGQPQQQQEPQQSVLQPLPPVGPVQQQQLLQRPAMAAMAVKGLLGNPSRRQSAATPPTGHTAADATGAVAAAATATAHTAGKAIGLSAKAALLGLPKNGGRAANKRRRSSVAKFGGVQSPPAANEQQQRQKLSVEQHGQQQQHGVLPAAKRRCSSAPAAPKAVVTNLTAPHAVDAAVQALQQQQQHKQQQPGPGKDTWVYSIRQQQGQGEGAAGESNALAGTAATPNDNAAQADDRQGGRADTPVKPADAAGKRRRAASCTPAAKSKSGSNRRAAPSSACTTRRQAATAGDAETASAASHAAGSAKDPQSSAIDIMDDIPVAPAAAAQTATAAAGVDSVIKPSSSTQQRRIPSRLLPWACGACTFENAGSAAECHMCGTAKGSAQPATAAAQVAIVAAAATTATASKRARRSRTPGPTPKQSAAASDTTEAAAAALRSTSKKRPPPNKVVKRADIQPLDGAAGAVVAAVPSTFANHLAQQRQAAGQQAGTARLSDMDTNDSWLPPKNKDKQMAMAAKQQRQQQCKHQEQQRQREQQQQQQLQQGAALQHKQQAQLPQTCPTSSRYQSTVHTNSDADAATARIDGVCADAPQGALEQEHQQQQQLCKQDKQQQEQGGQDAQQLQYAHAAFSCGIAATKAYSKKAPLSSSSRNNQTVAAGKASAVQKGKARMVGGLHQLGKKHPAAAKEPAAAGVRVAAPAAGAAAGPSRTISSSSYIAWTSVSLSVADLAKSAAQRLPGGFRVCVGGHEEGRVTHLVIGAERRTLKLLLSVANGAWLVKPEWITASLEKGHWQPVEDFQAHCRYTTVAAAVRARKAAGTCSAGPLVGKMIIVQCIGTSAAAAAATNSTGAAGAVTGGCGSGGGVLFMSHAAAAEHRQSLQRLVRALGGRVCGARAAQVCVVCRGASVPRELPAAAVAVREEWLLKLAETHEGADEVAGFEVARGK